MKNIVLVNGAGAGGSGWRGVYDNLDVFISAEYDLRSAQTLEEMADAIEGKPITVKLTPDVVSLAFLERVLHGVFPPESR